MKKMTGYQRKDFWNKQEKKQLIDHKYSTEEYKEKQVDLHSYLKEIKEALEPFITSPLKGRMINIHLENLLDVIKYYFTRDTQRVSIHHNKKYKNGAKEIFKFTRFLGTNEKADTVQQKIYKMLQLLIDSIKEQIEYIKEVEEKRHEKRSSLLNIQNAY